MKHLRTRKAPRRAVAVRPVVRPGPVVGHPAPEGWTVEEDRREEHVALSYLTAIRKAS